jgi:hypothetical protein
VKAHLLFQLALEPLAIQVEADTAGELGEAVNRAWHG